MWEMAIAKGPSSLCTKWMLTIMLLLLCQLEASRHPSLWCPRIMFSNVLWASFHHCPSCHEVSPVSVPVNPCLACLCWPFRILPDPCSPCWCSEWFFSSGRCSCIQQTLLSVSVVDGPCWWTIHLRAFCFLHGPSASWAQVYLYNRGVRFPVLLFR